MSNPAKRKEAIRAYKDRPDEGGIYYIENTQNGWKTPLMATPNLQGMQNRLNFAKKTNSALDQSIAKQWKEFGGDGFEMVIVEKLERKPEQTPQEFRDELTTLLEMHTETEA